MNKQEKMNKILTDMDNLSKAYETVEAFGNGWVLTIYNDEDEIKHQEFFNQMEERHASKCAERFVDKYTDYDDGWDWTLMPTSFWDNVKQ